MVVKNQSDHPVNSAACQEATGKSFEEWFAHLDSVDGIKLGRREGMLTMWKPGTDNWWATTVYVEYEAHKGIKKKDGLAEGYTICVTKTINAPVDKVYGT